MTGFLGDHLQLQKYISSYGVHHLESPIDYHIHILFSPYDEKLPSYYNQNHRFLCEHMDKHVLQKTKLFEKIEIQWFSMDDMKKYRNVFRPFYQTIVDFLIFKQSEVKPFLRKSKKKGKNKRKTLKK
jgi:hypothetical protein